MVCARLELIFHIFIPRVQRVACEPTIRTRSDARARRDRPGPTRPKEAASKTALAPSVLLNVMRVHD